MNGKRVEADRIFSNPSKTFSNPSQNLPKSSQNRPQNFPWGFLGEDLKNVSIFISIWIPPGLPKASQNRPKAVPKST